MPQPPSDVFESFHPRVQQWIWREGWTELRDIQEESARAILGTEHDVVIGSATASGKTEAAFLPIASRIADEAQTALAALYISPLKALINDQHRRLEDLFGSLDVPVHRWHGDVGAAPKRKLVAEPAGVLLITPESLEALFIRQGSRIPGLFDGLRFIVVDELHAFIGTERGRQLQSLMHRIELAVRRRVPRIALSATLGDMGLACEFLRPGHGAEVRSVVSVSNPQEVKLQIRGYKERLPDEASSEIMGEPERVEEAVSGDALDVGRDLYARLRGGRHIVFTNMRAQVELYADLLRRFSERDRVPNEFWPHHGSLSKALREDAEDALRSSGRPATVIATTTLELGIDVGEVETIAQIGPPPSVASMRQRLGRSGRRGSPAVLRIYVQESEIAKERPPHEQLRVDLVQSIAMVRLLVARWCEPPTAGALHLSTLVQQALSLLAQHGGVRADQMWSALCQSGPFRGVNPAMFGDLLRDLAASQLVTQTSDGEIVLDLAGERLLNHYDFYSAFVTPEEYRLVSGSRTLGSLPVTFPVVIDMHLIFGGRRWRVLAVDADQKVVELAPAGGGRAPRFGGAPALRHGHVRQEMRAVLGETGTPPFIDEAAAELLREARAAYRRYGLSERAIVPWGKDAVLFPWTGDRGLNTIMLQLLQRGMSAAIEGVAIVAPNTGVSELESHLQALVAEGPAFEIDLAEMVTNKVIEKHHRFLGDTLLSVDYASSHLDVEGAHAALQGCLFSGDTGTSSSSPSNT